MRNAGIALALAVLLLVVVLGVSDRGTHSTTTDASAGADAPAAVALEFKTEKGERHSYGEWAGITWHYFRATSANQQPVQLRKVIVNGRSDQPKCVIEYEDKTLRMGDTVSQDVDTNECGDIVQLTIVTANPPGEFTYKF